MSSPVSRRPELRALTGARFVAAAWVVAFHFLRDKGPGIHSLGETLVARGYVGVSFFFVLSGFVLTYNYRGALAEPNARLKSYALARFARVYPLYLVSLALGFAAAYPWLSKQPITLQSLLRDAQVLLLLNSFHHMGMFHLNWAAWSLSVEVMLYASLPWLVRGLVRQSTTQRTLLAALAYGSTMVAVHTFTQMDPDGLGHPLLPEDNGRYSAYFKFFPLLHCHAFLCGVIAAMWHEQSVAWLSEKSAILRELAATLLVASILGLVCTLPASAYLALNDGLLAPLWALLLVLLSGPQTLLSRLLAAPPLHALGKISYAIYILHVPLYLFIHEYFGWRTPAYLVSLLGASTVAYHCVEEPARRWLRGWLDAPDIGPAPARASHAG